MEIFNIKEGQNKHIHILKYIEKIDNIILQFNEAIVDGNGNAEGEDSEFILNKVLYYVQNIKQMMPTGKEIKQIKIQQEQIKDKLKLIEEGQDFLKQK